MVAAKMWLTLWIDTEQIKKCIKTAWLGLIIRHGFDINECVGYET